MYALTVQGKDKDDITSSKVIYLNASQIKYVNQRDTDFIATVQNNTAFRIEHKANKAQFSYGLKSTNIKIQKLGEDGVINNLRYEYDFKTNKLRVFTLKTDGSYNLYNTLEIGSSQYYEAVNDPNIRIAD